MMILGTMVISISEMQNTLKSKQGHQKAACEVLANPTEPCCECSRYKFSHCTNSTCTAGCQDPKKSICFMVYKAI